MAEGQYKRRKQLKPDQRFKIWAHDAECTLAGAFGNSLRRRLGGLPRRTFAADELGGWFTEPVLRADYLDLWGRIAAQCGSVRRNSTPQDDCMILYTVARAVAARRALEIGTHLGYSTLHLAAGLAGNGGDGRLTSVDRYDVNDEAAAPWRAYGEDISGADRLRRLGLDKAVEYVVSPSAEYLQNCRETFDLIFIDGDHSEVGAYFDILYALSRLADDGIILLHDFHDPDDPDLAHSHGQFGVFWALHRLQRHIPDLTVVRLKDVVAPTTTGNAPTSIAVLTRRAC